MIVACLHFLQGILLMTWKFSKAQRGRLEDTFVTGEEEEDTLLAIRGRRVRGRIPGGF